MAAAPLSLVVEVKKACPSRKTVMNDPNITLPELDSKESKEEQKMSHYGFAHHMDADFGTWRDKKISQGLKQRDERDKMTCDHTEPGKEAGLSTLLDYMESHTVFKSIKMSKYDLCHFYKVGLRGDFSELPTPTSLPPVTMCTAFLRKPSQTYFWYTHRTWSQQFACFKNSMPMPTFDALRWKLMLR